MDEMCQYDTNRSTSEPTEEDDDANPVEKIARDVEEANERFHSTTWPCVESTSSKH